jgi:hypothetical protein
MAMRGGPSWSPRLATATTPSAWPAGSSTPTARPARSAACTTRRGNRMGCCSRRAAPAGSPGARRARPPTGRMPTSSWPPASRAARASPTASASTHGCSSPSPPHRSAGSTPARRRGAWWCPATPIGRVPAARTVRGMAAGTGTTPKIPGWESRCVSPAMAARPRCSGRSRARAVAADHHRRPACPRPAGRPPGERAAAAGPDLLCQGGRVPTTRCDPLPRRHPPGRGHRLPLPRVPGPTTAAIHRRAARGRPTAVGPGRPGALPAF